MYLLFVYFEIVSVHCREEGCIEKYIPRGPRDFPKNGDFAPQGLRDLEGLNLKGLEQTTAPQEG